MLSSFRLRSRTRIAIPGSARRAAAHLFADDDVLAIEAALLSGRPLLVLGEPGVGKSQLARAAAVALDRPLAQLVVDSATEARDLRWREDPVERLAQAQLVAALRGTEALEERAKLDRRRFIEPGPLWWGFDWASAARHVETHRGRAGPHHGFGDPANGAVVLIDEIDKAHGDVPEGLLEALGDGAFTPTDCEKVTATGAPLVVITSNETKPLSGPFLRRCVVHELRLPVDRATLIKTLLAAGAAHFPAEDHPAATQSLLQHAAELTADDRLRAVEIGLSPRPGLAEFIDLLTAALSERRASDMPPEDAVKRLAPFFLRKHAELRR